ncbi:MAG: YitT family protein [Erysipelotrichaceae bacterium]|nr:YitT family protein [Erysipelotrichaceae bacterium]
MNKLKQILMIELGSFLFALSIGLFILPGKVLTGGVAGIVSLLSAYIDFDADIMVIILNTLLFIIGSILLGKEFFFNTLLYSISYPLMLLFVTRRMASVEIEPILASLYGGFIGGVAIGIMFRNGGSSGGVDVIALSLEKYFHIKVNHTIMAVDALTVLAGLYTYGLNAVLIGLLSVFMMSLAIERTLNFYQGGITAKKFEIISDKYKEISDDINNSVIDRGTSLIDIEGGYTGSRRKMLMVVASEDQVKAINEIINKYDPKAFVIISDTNEVNGEGFTYMARL